MYHIHWGLIEIYMFNKFTKILEVNLFAFAYKLFHEDFSSINGALSLCIKVPSSTLPLVIPEYILVVYMFNKFNARNDVSNVHFELSFLRLPFCRCCVVVARHGRPLLCAIAMIGCTTTIGWSFTGNNRL